MHLAQLENIWCSVSLLTLPIAAVVQRILTATGCVSCFLDVIALATCAAWALQLLTTQAPSLFLIRDGTCHWIDSCIIASELCTYQFTCKTYISPCITTLCNIPIWRNMDHIVSLSITARVTYYLAPKLCVTSPLGRIQITLSA